MEINLSQYDQSHYHRGRSVFIISLWNIVNALLFKTSFRPMNQYRVFLLRLFGAKIGANVIIRPSAKINYPWNISIGEASWIGEEVVLYSLGKISIGAHCVISQYAHLCTGSHNIQSKTFKLEVSPIKLEDYCWVATDAYLGLGVTMSQGSVIGARSSVYKDTQPWMVYIGNPAKATKKRTIEDY